MPVKKIVTIPLIPNTSAVIKGMYIINIYKLNSRIGAVRKSACLKISADTDANMIPMKGQPNTSNKNSVRKDVISFINDCLSLIPPIWTRCENDLNKTIATASFNADSPNTSENKWGLTFLEFKTPNTLTVSVAVINDPNVNNSNKFISMSSLNQPKVDNPYRSNPVTIPETAVPTTAKDTIGFKCRKNNSRFNSYPELNKMGGKNTIKNTSPEKFNKNSDNKFGSTPPYLLLSLLYDDDTLKNNLIKNEKIALTINIIAGSDNIEFNVGRLCNTFPNINTSANNNRKNRKKTGSVLRPSSSLSSSFGYAYAASSL
mmetsp:Transcript_3316/g.3634  ORF Transcript_3316/g.3634 Transcript_3316/m.3634 type:complete len:316 (-) Transcript_3316:94-1041(-)